MGGHLGGASSPCPERPRLPGAPSAPHSLSMWAARRGRGPWLSLQDCGSPPLSASCGAHPTSCPSPWVSAHSQTPGTRTPLLASSQDQGAPARDIWGQPMVRVQTQGPDMAQLSPSTHLPRNQRQHLPRGWGSSELQRPAPHLLTEAPTVVTVGELGFNLGTTGSLGRQRQALGALGDSCGRWPGWGRDPEIMTQGHDGWTRGQACWCPLQLECTWSTALRLSESPVPLHPPFGATRRI